MKNSKFSSKKFTAMVIGVSLTTIFTIGAVTVMAFTPQISSAIVNLITVSMASLNGLLALYVTGQSAVDWKINSSHQTTQENSIETKIYEMQYSGGGDLNIEENNFEFPRKPVPPRRPTN